MRSITISLISILVAINLFAQDVTTVTATADSIAQNLDLEAVASVFGESKDLEDFEKRLNDPDSQISNLDLNGDGEVDYLRVVENSESNTHVVSIQAVIGKDQYQDVATIIVEKDSNDNTSVQVVGDVYMYGPDYVIQPVYVRPPIVITWFWGPYYNPWRSPYYWGYYPPYYRPWTPYPPYRYQSNVRVNINVNNTYNRTTVKRSNTAVNIQNKNRRNDYGSKYPRQTTTDRKNSAQTKDVKRPAETKVPSTGKKVQSDWKTSSDNKSDVKTSVQKKSNTLPRSTENKTKNNSNVQTRQNSNTNNVKTRNTSKSGRGNSGTKRTTSKRGRK